MDILRSQKQNDDYWPGCFTLISFKRNENSSLLLVSSCRNDNHVAALCKLTFFFALPSPLLSRVDYFKLPELPMSHTNLICSEYLISCEDKG